MAVPSFTPDTPEPPAQSAERVEVLGVRLLDSLRPLVNQFHKLSVELGIGLGWHYLLDLAWAAHEASCLQPGQLALDAGAGTGLMQWWLSEHRVNVISVDRQNRFNLRPSLRLRYPIAGWRPQDLSPMPKPSLRSFLPSSRPRLWRQYPGKLAQAAQQCRGKEGGAGKGRVHIYNHDLSQMPDISDNSIDMVVSISSLEHNTPQGLRNCVVELMRVLKPGGKLVATLGASRGQDWFHEPSQGWCYTEASLRLAFDLPENCPSNYAQYDELMAQLRGCAELRDNLASFYFRGGNNGMPWGKWDPQYQTVGVVKIKPIS